MTRLELYGIIAGGSLGLAGLVGNDFGPWAALPFAVLGAVFLSLLVAGNRGRQA